MTAERLQELCSIQSGILDDIAGLVAPTGRIGFVTCSVLDCENGDQVARFLATHPEWFLENSSKFLPGDPGDGFFVAVMQKR